VETSMILDIYEKWGLDVIAQVDLDKRVHRNQNTTALGKMAFAIMKTFLKRIEHLGYIDIKKDMFDEMMQFSNIGEKYIPDTHQIEVHERPPIIEIPEYCKKFKSVP